MPDITICQNNECPMKEKCRRNEMHWQGKMDPYQSYTHFECDFTLYCIGFMEKKDITYEQHH